MSQEHDTAGPDPLEPARYDTLETLWQDPAPSLATRNISRRSKGSGRAVVVGGLDHREIHCESLLEANVLATLLADKQRVLDVQEQPGVVAYVDIEGRDRAHYFDFLVTMRDGRRIAIAVKPEKRSARLENDFDQIIRYAGPFADAYLLVTDTSLTEHSVYNAWLILAARRDHNPEADAKVSAVAASLHGQIAIEDLVDACDIGAPAFHAIVRLIDNGELRLSAHGRIDYGVNVERCEVENAGVAA